MFCSCVTVRPRIRSSSRVWVFTFSDTRTWSGRDARPEDFGCGPSLGPRPALGRSEGVWGCGPETPAPLFPLSVGSNRRGPCHRASPQCHALCRPASCYANALFLPLLRHFYSSGSETTTPQRPIRQAARRQVGLLQRTFPAFAM